MSNALIKSIEQLQKDEEKRKLKEIANLNHNMAIFKEDIINIFSKEIVESFDILEIHPVEKQYYSYKAILIYDGTPIHLHMQNVGLMQPGPMQASLYVGTETLKHFQVTLPSKRVIDNTIKDRYNVSGFPVTPDEVLNQIQKSNDAKLVSCLNESITKRIAELKVSKPKWWFDIVPRNYSGASKVESLLKNLENDKIFLTDEIYDKLVTILNGILLDAKIKELEDQKLKEKNIAIVSNEKKIYEEAYKKYEEDLIRICKELAEHYFKPWTLYTAVYFPENFDPRGLKDEDGEVENDLIEAVTAQSNYTGEPDSEGYVNCVNPYGNTHKRKLSSNLYHTDKTEFKEPLNTMTHINFWKRIIPDSRCNNIGFNVPPGTVVEIHEFPVRPITWEEKCKEQGIRDPWNWR